MAWTDKDLFAETIRCNIVTTAIKKKISPDNVSENSHFFDSYRQHQADIMADLCRQRGLPNVFITIAPAEWKFPLHMPLFSRFGKNVDEVQGILTLHLYNCLMRVVDKVFRDSSMFKGLDWSVRVEFQSRGTLHIHICEWCLLDLSLIHITEPTRPN